MPGVEETPGGARRISQAVRMEGIVKRFPGVLANAGIDFSLDFGEAHGLLGENGAGKTVLMSILYGLYQPDAGRIFVRGTPTRIGSPAVAIRIGIGMVHQHFMLVPRLTVAENIAVGWEPTRGPLLDRRAMVRRIEALVEQYGLGVDPEARVEELAVGEQQRVEILKALYRGAEVLILDEPTAVLAEQEAEALFAAVRALKEQGKAVVFITHKLDEALAVCDRITVLRKGKNVGTLPASEATETQLAELMVGREVVFQVRPEPVVSEGQPLVAVEGLVATDDRGVEAVRGVSVVVHDHEILGIAGVQGNGQKELVEAICGLRQPQAGHVSVGGRDLTGASPRKLTRAGLVHVPEDRQQRGLILPFTVAENAILGQEYDPRFAIGPWAQARRNIARYAQELVERFSIAAPSVRTSVQALSGGNQQRLILARELGRGPRVVVAVQPTRGLDVAGMEFVWNQLLAMRRQGCAVLLVSMDLDEVMMLSDRIAVMYQGEVVAVVRRGEATKRELGLWMLRGKGEVA
ncbi:MAG: ABC transporter ATP-binding protein [Candidatus Acetothermia bacterium]|nr:ABC transporter ATP-binding protein [Candidatus Acetothermia bacterium]